MRVADSGHDGRQPEEEGRAGQHVEGDDERNGELVGALVAEQLRALETGLNSKPRDVYNFIRHFGAPSQEHQSREGGSPHLRSRSPEWRGRVRWR